jgi:hypothetical protein
VNLKIVQRLWDRLRGKDVIKKNPVATHYGERFVYRGENGESVVAETLKKGGPSMIVRFGRTELKVVEWFMRSMDQPSVAFRRERAAQLAVNAGFINPTDLDLTRYSCEFIQITRDVDVLGVWFAINEREMVERYLPLRSKLIALDVLTPGPVFRKPWTRFLAGKKVLVIHHMEDTVREQYKKREFLFSNPEILPEFELITMKAYQSCAGNNPAGYASWFDALDDMNRAIDALDFDVALIGAGAYGMFLAHHCKALGKTAIQMGGATQLLFGIKGRRWEDPKHDYGKRFFNEYWVRPLPHEIPEGSQTVEGGCYW